jgi:predicted kinase
VKLVVMTGLPGAGKSAVADALGAALAAPVLSVDPIEDAIRRAGIGTDQPTGYAAYVVADALARRMLALGLTVVIDAANLVAVAQDQWRRLAAECAVPMHVIEVVCSDASLHRNRLESRVRGLTAYAEPTWAEIEKRRATVDPWPEEHLILDSIRPHDANIADALTHLRS